AGEKRHRSLVADAADARGARTSQSPVRSDQTGFTRAARTDQARASPRRSDAGRGITSGYENESDGREDRPAQSGSRAGNAPESQETRARSGLRHWSNVRQGTQGYQGAFGSSRSRGRQASVRGRSDAAHSSCTETWFYEY